VVTPEVAHGFLLSGIKLTPANLPKLVGEIADDAVIKAAKAILPLVKALAAAKARK
jgi:hypothetical protein